MCQGKITTHLVAFFMQTVKDMSYNILKCSFRFVEYLICKIVYRYWSGVAIVCTLIKHAAPTCQGHATPGVIAL